MGDSGRAAGAAGEGGYEVPKKDRVGMTWKLQGTPRPQHNIARPPRRGCKYQLPREASQNSGTVFKEMQFDLPSSSRNPANRMLPESLGLIPAMGAATVIFNKS